MTLDDDASGGETNAHPDLLVSGGVGRVEEIEALVGKSGVQADAIVTHSVTTVSNRLNTTPFMVILTSQVGQLVSRLQPWSVSGLSGAIRT